MAIYCDSNRAGVPVSKPELLTFLGAEACSCAVVPKLGLCLLVCAADVGAASSLQIAPQVTHACQHRCSCCRLLLEQYLQQYLQQHQQSRQHHLSRNATMQYCIHSQSANLQQVCSCGIFLLNILTRLLRQQMSDSIKADLLEPASIATLKASNMA